MRRNRLLIFFTASLLLTACGNTTQQEQETEQQQQKTGDATTDDTSTDQSQKQDDSQSEGAAQEKCPAGYTGENCDQCLDGVTDSMTDTAGTNYKTVCINSNFWMAENMNFATGTYYHANDDAANDANYGLLYDWETASTICPTGWHLPTKQEIEDLLTYVTEHRTSSSNFLALVPNSELWTNLSQPAGDDFGFGALPAGDYYDGKYNNFGTDCYIWLSSGDGDAIADIFYLGYGSTYVFSNHKLYGFSVRCVKDAN